MDVLLLVVGVAIAAVAGDRFVAGAIGAGHWFRLPPAVVGATIAAFATSSPELSVGVLAAIDDRPALAFGDATGSNLVNLGVVLGLTLVFGSIAVRWDAVRREVITALVAVLLLGVVALDGRIGRLDSVVLLGTLVVWLVWVVCDVRVHRFGDPTNSEVDRGRTVRDLLVGLAFLIVAGRLVVVAAKGIGASLGWSEFVVGSILVAIATSTPELVTAVVAARRGHVDVGVGTVLGSNVFNSLFIVGTAGTISAIDVDRPTASVALGAALVATLLVLPGRSARLGRWRGVVLITWYVVYVVGLLVV